MFSFSLSSFDLFRLVILFLIILLTRWLYHVKRPGLPPGPFPLPIIGNLLALRRGAGRMDHFLLEMSRVYGDIFAFYIGNHRLVVIAGHENLKESFTRTGEDLLDRPYFHFGHKIAKGSKGIIVSNGKRWKDGRKFALMAMKNFDFGRTSLQTKVTDETAALTVWLMKHAGEVMDIRHAMTTAVSNIICSIVYGRRFDYDDPEFRVATHALESLFKRGGTGSVAALANFMPWLRMVPFIGNLDYEHGAVEVFIRKHIEEHRASFDPDNIRDFIDMYLQIERGETGYDPEIFDDDHMFVTIRDLFLAGTETTSSSVLWAIIYLAKYPEVQSKCRDEINRVCGKDTVPNLSHKEQMPYLHAMILETQRLGDISAMSIMRCAARDVKLCGHDVPKGTTIINLIHSAHYDERCWPNVAEFLPERWLDENNTIVNHDSFIPFALGKRSCMGENLAKIELFLFVTHLIQRFEFTAPVPGEEVNVASIMGIARVPVDCRVNIKSLV